MIKRNHGESRKVKCHIGNHKGNFIVTRVAEGRWACNEHLEKGIAVSNINDIMVDLETLGTLPGSVIISIGAVGFNEMEVVEGLHTEFYNAVQRLDCERLGLKTSASTLAWWEKQTDEARRVLTDPSAVPLAAALTDFNEWLSYFGDDVRIWGNGANFDNPLLACAYEAAGIRPRYKFWNERCYRTVKNQFPDIKLERSGTYHNALDDARCQAKHLVEICQKRDWRLR
jgi:hypothetical protein